MAKKATSATQRQARHGGAKKYPLESLAKNSRKLFGVSSCTFAGATAGLSGSYTMAEIKSIIEEWCGKKGV